MRIVVAVLLALILLPQVSDAKKKPKPRGYPVLPGVYLLHGSDPGLPKDDLEPLRKIIDTATVVSLGESFHTSGGYYEMKHRLFRFLVEQMGFRGFAIESPWEDADLVGKYVEACEGSLDDALRGLSLRTDRTVEKLLHELGHAALLVDFDFPGGKPPFLAPGEEYRISDLGMTPAAQFDAAVFLDHSRKMDPLNWPSCR